MNGMLIKRIPNENYLIRGQNTLLTLCSYQHFLH
jgi:hypothetical protein